MKKTTHRAVAVLLLAAAVICGMVVYVIRYVDAGEDWALYFSRANSGSTGQLRDRYGESLAWFNGYENLFSGDELTRVANYHVTGDYWGRTGSGILEEYWSGMQNFDLINGTTRSEHSTMELNIDAFMNRVIYTQLNKLEKPPKDEETVEDADGDTEASPVPSPSPSPVSERPEAPAEPVFSLSTGQLIESETQEPEETPGVELDENGNPLPPEPEKYNGAVLVCNYRTGELLGMVSTPSVDPMDVEGTAKDGSYINRCLSASFIPGSIFKLITAAAAIENIPDLYGESFECTGEHRIAGVPITCMVPHGEQSFQEALANSCNCAFAQLAVRMGQDTMVRYMRELGFLDSQSLDGISTAAGSYPLEFVGDPELGWSGIGQSTDLICPYAMLRFVCAVANGGVLYEPSIVRDAEDGVISRYMSADTANKLKDIMRYTVENHYGGEEAFPGLALCAKTGTAELGDGTTHAWFVGFLEDDEHPFAFVTFVEQGGRGLEVAGSLTNKIFQQYFALR